MKKIIAPSINSVGQCNNLNRSLATMAHQAQAKRSQSSSIDCSIDRGATLKEFEEWQQEANNRMTYINAKPSFKTWTS